jgi:hypothetical protein
MSLAYGTNEAYDRMMKELKETNDGGIEYPQATNNRGYIGGNSHGARENHAAGDVVGNRSQPGEHMRKAMRRGDRARHAEGDVVRDVRHLARGMSVTANSEQPGEKMSRGGRAHRGRQHHLLGDCAE